MIVHEEQAKKKRCCGPLGCGKFDDSERFNAYPGSIESAPISAILFSRYCVGSECMGWQEIKGQCTYPLKKDGSGYDERWDNAIPGIDKGYCGLAGKQK